MKKNHESIIKFIQQAIVACKEDSSLLPVKRYLIEALRITQNVGNKRISRDNETKRYAEQAKKNNERWMEMLQKIKFPEIEENLP